MTNSIASRTLCPMDMERKVLAIMPKSADLKYHVSLISTEHGTFLDFREFIVSLEEYGRGVTMPVENWEQIRLAVDAAMEGSESNAGADDSDPLPVM